MKAGKKSGRETQTMGFEKTTWPDTKPQVLRSVLVDDLGKARELPKKEKLILSWPRGKFIKKLPKLIPLSALRAKKELKGMPLLQQGQRLSIQPVTKSEWQITHKLIQELW